MVEQIAVAGDDRIGSSFAGQRYAIVVVGIAQQRLNLCGVVVLDGYLFDTGDNLRQVVGVEALLEAPPPGRLATPEAKPSKAERRADVALVVSYHEVRLADLLERVREGFERYDAGDLKQAHLRGVLALG